MRSLLRIATGPIILALAAWYSVYSGLVSFAEQQDGLEHTAGVQPGGTLVVEQTDTYQCDENGNNCVLVDSNTEMSEIEGLKLEEQPIEYRNGSEDITVRKMPSIPKFTNITVKRPKGFDWGELKFTFGE